MKPEQRIWRYLQDKIPGHIVRIESSTENGIPDVNGCYKGFHYWLEIKNEENGVVKIRKEQHVFAFRRHKEEGTTYLLSKCQMMGTIKLWKYPYEVISINEEFKMVTSKPNVEAVTGTESVNQLIMRLVENKV